MNGTDYFRYSEYFVGTSNNPPSARRLLSTDNGNEQGGDFLVDDIFTEIDGHVVLVSIEHGNYNFYDLSAEPVQHSFIETTAQKVRHVSMLETCPIPGCQQVFSNIALLEKTFVNGVSLTKDEELKFQNTFGPRPRSWKGKDGKVISADKIRNAALPAIQSAVNGIKVPPGQQLPAIGASDIRIADVNNDGSPDAYVSVSEDGFLGEGILFGSTEDWSALSDVKVTNLRHDFKNYDAHNIGDGREGEDHYWYGNHYFVFEDAKGTVHFGQYGEEWFPGGRYECCWLELRTIRDNEFKLDFLGQTSETWVNTNYLAFGNMSPEK